MAAQLVTNMQRWICESGDTKPTSAPVGSVCQELDTGLLFIWDGTSWVEDLALFTAVQAALAE